VAEAAPNETAAAFCCNGVPGVAAGGSANVGDCLAYLKQTSPTSGMGGTGGTGGAGGEGGEEEEEETPRTREWVSVAPKFGSENFIFSTVVFKGTTIYAGTRPFGRLLRWKENLDPEESGAWEGVTQQLGTQTDIYSLAVFGGSIYGGTYPGGKLYKWTEGDDKWVDTGAVSGENAIQSLLVSGDYLYAGTNGQGRLLRFNPAGNSWDQMARNFLTADKTIYSLVELDGAIYGSTGGGKLLKWTPGGNSWEMVADKFDNENRVYSLVVFNDEEIYGSTFPGGLLLKWDSAERRWVQKAGKITDSEDNPLEGILSIPSVVVFDDGTGKAIYGGIVPTGALYKWDGNDSWELKASKLGSVIELRAFIVFKQRLFAGTAPNGNLYEWK